MSENIPITITTDFGLKDEYSGSVKALLLRYCPGANIVEITHQVTPFSIIEGAFILAAAAPNFKKAVHLAVVDPGVGSSRRALILKTGLGHWLVGPDNGLLIPAADRLGGVVEAYEIKPEKFIAHRISPTFHARDIFAPAAALLAAGIGAFELGEPVDISTLAGSPWSNKVTSEAAETVVASIDRFGTLRLPVYFNELKAAWGDFRKIKLSNGKMETIISKGDYFLQFSQGEIFFYEDSSAFLAISANLDRADKILGLELGQEVKLQKMEAG